MYGRNTGKMGNVAKGAGDHLAILVALDLSPFGWTRKLKTQAGLKKLQKDL